MERVPGAARAVRYGGPIVALYVAVAALTVVASSSRVLPLFEGIGPLTPYHWVDPPPEFAAGNVAPSGAETDIVLDASGSPAAVAATDDAQCLVTLPAGALAPRAEDTSVRAQITPLAPADLADPPDGLRADGNAYRVELTYQPSGIPVEELAEDGNVVLAVPEPAVTLLYSADGGNWERLETVQLAGSGSVGTRFARPGFYLAAALPMPSPAPAGGDGGQVVAVAAATAALALVLVLAPVVRRRLRGRGG